MWRMSDLGLLFPIHSSVTQVQTARKKIAIQRLYTPLCPPFLSQKSYTVVLVLLSVSNTGTPYFRPELRGLRRVHKPE